MKVSLVNTTIEIPSQFRQVKNNRQVIDASQNSGFLLLATLCLASVQVEAESQKQIVGATETVFVTDANLRIEARVDTGAKTSSIHAENIELDILGDPQGKPISFILVTKDGQSNKVETRVISVVTVKTSEQSERRYVVPLRIKWRDSERVVSVTLNDRKNMRYRLLLGRNWLRGHYIVDVDKNAEDKSSLDHSTKDRP